MEILCLMLANGVKLELLSSEVVAGQLQIPSEPYQGLFTSNMMFRKRLYHKVFRSELVNVNVKRDLCRIKVLSSASFLFTHNL